MSRRLSPDEQLGKTIVWGIILTVVAALVFVSLLAGVGYSLWAVLS